MPARSNKRKKYNNNNNNNTDNSTTAAAATETSAAAAAEDNNTNHDTTRSKYFNNNEKNTKSNKKKKVGGGGNESGGLVLDPIMEEEVEVEVPQQQQQDEAMAATDPAAAAFCNNKNNIKDDGSVELLVPGSEREDNDTGDDTHDNHDQFYQSEDEVDNIFANSSVVATTSYNNPIRCDGLDGLDDNNAKKSKTNNKANNSNNNKKKRQRRRLPRLLLDDDDDENVNDQKDDDNNKKNGGRKKKKQQQQQREIIALDDDDDDDEGGKGGEAAKADDDNNDGDDDCVIVTATNRTTRSSSGQANSSNSSRSGGGSRIIKKKKAQQHQQQPDIIGEIALDRLVRLAEYELDIDPYRGMCANDTTTSPWIRSCTVVIVPPTPKTASSSSTNDGSNGGNDANAGDDDDGLMDSDEDEEDDPSLIVKRVCRNQCPCLLKWTDDAIVAHQQQQLARKKAAAAAAKRKKNKNKKGTTATTNAEDEEDNQEDESSSAPVLLGRRPTSLESKSAKNKQLQQSKSKQPNLRCTCDYNPFCLTSLGGVIDDILQDEAAAALATAATTEQERQQQKRGRREQEQQQQQQLQKRDSSLSIGKMNNNCGNPTTTTTTTTPSPELGTAAGQPPDRPPPVDRRRRRSNSTATTADTTNDDDDADDVVVLGTTTTANNDNGNGKKDNQPIITISDRRRMIIPDRYLDDGASPYYLEPLTKQRLEKVRKSCFIQTDRVKQYLSQTLHSLTKVMPLDNCIEVLRQRHAKQLLTLKNHNNSPSLPPANDIDDTEQYMELVMPPGIENLGATCYLNTQLQCLAQNLVFIEGMFAWQSSQQQRPEGGGDNNTANSNNNNSDRMESVLRLFQELMANMRQGPYSTIQTLDFSNALDLDHYEQQDPNEFSRLLLERFHESFQKTNGGGRKSLARLLPEVFEGTVVYETTCLACSNVSRRQEKFMDMNLPIVKPPPSDNKTNGSNEEREEEKAGSDGPLRAVWRKVLSTFNGSGNKSAGGDTDVQVCLDEYFQHEVLEGDNKYFCNCCQSKQDAKRQPLMEKPPPVLNVQLSRYVYDRSKGTKKKLCDKVLLPQELTVNATTTTSSSDALSLEDDNNGGTSGASKDHAQQSPRRYILCAVMRHHGTSAYSGHYVAEAMDWLTGIWYEFNDEKVSVIDKPSNSYDEATMSEVAAHQLDDSMNNNDKKKRKTSSMPKGSENAYNMYYVEESFLASSVFDSLKHQKVEAAAAFASEEKDGGDEDGHHPLPDVIHQIIQKRANEYSTISMMCEDDYRVSSRMEQRRRTIRQDIIRNVSHLQPGNSTNNLVWVDGEQLRRLLSCARIDTKDDSTTFSTAADGTLIMTEGGGLVPSLNSCQFLCHHSEPGLHPVTARRGKLIRREIYDALVTLIDADRTYFGLDSSNNNTQEDNSTIIPYGNMKCDKCAEEYTQNLNYKVELIVALRDLYKALNPKNDDPPLEYYDTEVKQEEEWFLYIVSKNFVTNFRKLVTRHIIKTASLTGALGSATIDIDLAADASHPCTKAECILEGIDAFDIADLYTISGLGGYATMMNNEGGDALDVAVNSKLCCRHGNLSKKPDKRYVRFVSWRTWTTLKGLFPNAIELRKKRQKKSAAANDDDGFVVCQQCIRDVNAEGSLRQLLQDFAGACIMPVVDMDGDGNNSSMAAAAFDNIVQKEIVESPIKSNANGTAPGTVQQHERKRYRIVPKDDIEAWQQFLRTYRAGGNGGQKNNKKKPTAGTAGDTADATKALVESVKSLLSPSVEWLQASPLSSLQSNSGIITAAETINDATTKQESEWLHVLSRMLRPVACLLHHKPIHRAMFQALSEEEQHAVVPSSSPPGLDFSRVTLLEDTKYQEYLIGLIAVIIILDPPPELEQQQQERSSATGSSSSSSDDNSNNEAINDVGKLEQIMIIAREFCSKMKLLDKLHPAFFCGEKGGDGDNDGCQGEKFHATSKAHNMGLWFKLIPSSCRNFSCCREYQLWQKEEGDKKAEEESNNASKNKKKNGTSAATTTTTTNGNKTGTATEIINLVDDGEEGKVNEDDKFSLRVFEADMDADDDKILASLSSNSSVSPLISSSVPETNGTTAAAASSIQPVRRSRRRRAGNLYPPGCPIVSEDTLTNIMSLDHNVAALRLFLMEGCSSGMMGYELNHSVKLVLINPDDFILDDDSSIGSGNNMFPPFPPTSTAPMIVNLDYDLNFESVRELCESALEKKLPRTFRPAKDLVVVRQPNIDFSCVGLPDEEMMQDLIESSNATTLGGNDDPPRGGKGGGSTKSRAAERGFSGTLLGGGGGGGGGNSGATTTKKDEDKNEDNDKDGGGGGGASDGPKAVDEAPTTKESRVVAPPEETKQQEQQRAVEGPSPPKKRKTGKNGINERGAAAGSGCGNKQEVIVEVLDDESDDGTDTNLDYDSSSSSTGGGTNRTRRRQGQPKRARARAPPPSPTSSSVGDPPPHRRTKRKKATTSHRQQSVLELLHAQKTKSAEKEYAELEKKRDAQQSNKRRLRQTSQRARKKDILGNNSSDDDDDDADLAKLVLAVSEKLLGNPDVDDRKKNDCYKSAQWAVEEHYNDDGRTMDDAVTSLTNMAYAKYVELTMT